VSLHDVIGIIQTPTDSDSFVTTIFRFSLTLETRRSRLAASCEMRTVACINENR
jgi:hypothetical protein